MNLQSRTTCATLMGIVLFGAGSVNCSSPGPKAEGVANTTEPLSIGPLRDFNRDGEPDLLWHNQSTGELDAWFMYGALQVGSNSIKDQSTQLLRPVPSGWDVAGSADINLDGMTDILVHNQATGELQAWFMSGTDRTAVQWINVGSPAGPHATLAQGELFCAIGDVDKNGSVDFITYMPTDGFVRVWFMSGTDQKSVSTMELGNPFTPLGDPNWRLVSAADINVDGYIDLVWHNLGTGLIGVVFFRGTTNLGYTYVANRDSRVLLQLPVPWYVKGTADTNNDGFADLIVHNTNSGFTVLYKMTGTDWFDVPHTVTNGTNQLVETAPTVLTAD